MAVFSVWRRGVAVCNVGRGRRGCLVCGGEQWMFVVCGDVYLITYYVVHTGNFQNVYSFKKKH